MRTVGNRVNFIFISRQRGGGVHFDWTDFERVLRGESLRRDGKPDLAGREWEELHGGAIQQARHQSTR